MGATELTIIATCVLVVGLLFIIQRRVQRDSSAFRLRPIAAYEALRTQLGMAMESGLRPLFTLGTGPLHSTAGPTSIAGLQVLDALAESTGRGKLSPLVTVGAGTLLPIANDRLRFAGEERLPASDVTSAGAQFIADEAFPFAYAAGTADTIQNRDLENSIAFGRFGAELAIIGEAASRAGLEQIMGSDEPSAITIALATTENSLWGEEIFAAGAYLRGTSSHLATVRVQDVLRWIVVTALLSVAVLRLLGLL